MANAPVKNSGMNLPSKQYDISNMSQMEKLNILIDDNRFSKLEKSGIEWKITVTVWNGASMKGVTYGNSNRDNAIDWALQELRLVK